MRLGPVGFLFAVVIGWAAIRAGLLWPEAETRAASPRIVWQPPLSRYVAAPAPMPARREIAAAVALVPPPRPQVPPPPRVQFAVVAEAAAAAPPQAVPAVTPVHPPMFRRATSPAPARRWHVSAWSIVRDEGGGQLLAAAGQLGGSQAGVRASFEIGAGFALASRASTPLSSGRGKEVALGLDWRPIRRVPLTLTVERRAGLDRGGRDAFAAGVFGGFERRGLPLRAMLDGYAQAGVVGLKRRDAYVDGALRIEAPVADVHKLRIGAGAGIWGGAQPKVSRLDVGPQIVLHLPLRSAGLRIGAEWRQRVAGNARPDSGPALSIGADF